MGNKCIQCGHCCFGIAGDVYYNDDDIKRWQEKGKNGLLPNNNFGGVQWGMYDLGGCSEYCRYQKPDLDNNIYTCILHHDNLKPLNCREFEPGCDQCIEYRKIHGFPTPKESFAIVGLAMLLEFYKSRISKELENDNLSIVVHRKENWLEFKCMVLEDDEINLDDFKITLKRGFDYCEH